MIYFLIFILIGFLVLIHELGHFIVAKILKIDVEVFSIGFGPKLFSFKKFNTEFKIASIPFGGYVLLNSNDTDAIFKTPLYKRLLFTIGGPAANLIFAYLAVFIINLQMDISFISIVAKTFIETNNYIHTFITLIPAVFENQDQISGIIGMVIQGSDFVGFDFIRLLQFIVTLNINLAIINIIPFPPLDGGNILLHIVQKIYPKAENLQIPFAIAGWILLVGIMLYSTVQDIGRYLI